LRDNIASVTGVQILYLKINNTKFYIQWYYTRCTKLHAIIPGRATVFNV